MTVFKDFLLQLTLIAIPILAYHTFFGQRKREIDTWIRSLLWSLSILLCMTFPVVVAPGESFDLRFVPLMLGTLYRGYASGIFFVLLVIAYRCLYGFDLGLIHSLLNLIVTTPVVFLCIPSFQRARKEKRVKIAAWLSGYYSFVIVFFYFLLRPHPWQNFGALLTFLVISMISTLFFLTLNEIIRENHRLEQEIQKAEKLSVLSDLTGSFAHEIRNPMQVNRGFLQLIQQDVTLSDTVKGYIRLCIQEVDRANEIINDYLSFARPSSGQCQPVKISEQFWQVKNLLSPYALSHNVDICIKTEDSLFISANPQKFNQCLINLIKNGIEAMPDGGVILITGFLQDEQVCIEVADQGVGMTKEQISQLGSPFYTLKDRGTGVGLMVTFRLIQSFQGAVRVTSEVGKGSVFTLVFPQCTEVVREAHDSDDENQGSPSVLLPNLSEHPKA